MRVDDGYGTWPWRFGVFDLHTRCEAPLGIGMGR